MLIKLDLTILRVYILISFGLPIDPIIFQFSIFKFAVTVQLPGIQIHEHIWIPGIQIPGTWLRDQWIRLQIRFEVRVHSYTPP